MDDVITEKKYMKNIEVRFLQYRRGNNSKLVEEKKTK